MAEKEEEKEWKQIEPNLLLAAIETSECISGWKSKTQNLKWQT